MNEEQTKLGQNGDVLVARWETRGNDWLELTYHPRYGYSYRGNGCGGGVKSNVEECLKLTDAEAIAEMERPWNGNGRPGAGQAFVLRQDRKSLKLTFVRKS